MPNHQECGFEKVIIAGSSSSSSKGKKQKRVSHNSTSQADSTLVKQLKQLKNQILQSRTHLANFSKGDTTFTEEKITQMQMALTLLEALQADLKLELLAKQHPRNKQSFSMNA